MSVKKLLCFFICAISCLFVFPTTAQAADSEIMPMYDYTRQASSALGISSNKATVSISCTGLSDEDVSKINAETCLQRKVGLIWVKVDIGTTDNVWKDSTSKYYLNASHSATISKSGSYRAKTVFTVYNPSGKSEKITIYSNTVKYN